MSVRDLLFAEYQEHTVDLSLGSERRYRTIADVDLEYETRCVGDVALVPENMGADRAKVVYGEFEVVKNISTSDRCTGCESPTCIECNRVTPKTLQKENKTPMGGGGGDATGKSKPRLRKVKDDKAEAQEPDSIRWRVWGLTRGEADFYDRRPGEALHVLRVLAGKLEREDVVASRDAGPLIEIRRERLRSNFSVYGLTQHQYDLIYTERGLASRELAWHARGVDAARVESIDRNFALEAAKVAAAVAAAGMSTFGHVVDVKNQVPA
jgi:hypothetical protein